MNHLLYLLLPLAFVFLLGMGSTNASKAYVCKNLSFNMTVSSSKVDQIVYKYSADLALSVADSIHTVITMDNHTHWSLNESLYYQLSPPQYVDSEQGVIKCKNNTGLCKLTVFDSAGWYEVPLKMQHWTYAPSFTDFLVFDQGTVYFNDGTFFDPVQAPCAEAYELDYNGPPYNSVFNYCCNEFVEVDIPEKTSTSCIEFDGNTTFYAQSGAQSATFSAKYTVTSTGMQVKVQDHYLPKDTVYDFIPNNSGTGCVRKSSPDCSFTMNTYKYEDYQYDMFITIFDEETTYGTTIAGKILSRNGVLVRHQNEPYTPRDPCWVRHFPSNDGGRALNSFCCMKFKKEAIVESMKPKGVPVKKGVKKMFRKKGRKNLIFH